MSAHRCNWLRPIAADCDRSRPFAIDKRRALDACTHNLPQRRSRTMTKKSALAWALAAACAAPLALAFAPAAANAQTVVQQYQPAGVLSLNAQASAEVPQDV